ncbi:two-component system chemotaxis response regulator CheY [Cellulomonas hominis]|uniref:Two-component system chemotaxis response regulator CheY n=2 Tax=Cellulomonas hominis TaxID=156981 RepID=A0A7W8W964_9CELL|nr:two-component system chemotaxis response regulator CheY [Cellulomonas hominis]
MTSMIRVLIADDSRVMRQIVIRTLRQAGYDWDVREASDGQEALEAVRADEPDVVLSDWNMPNLTGIELLRRLRQEGFTTPFGFVTSEGSDEMRTLADEAGALFLIAKPFTADTFRDAIEPVLA